MTTKSDLRKLMSVRELAAFAGVTVATVYDWNYKGTGPPVVKQGKYARYRPADVERWVLANRVDTG